MSACWPTLSGSRTGDLLALIGLYGIMSYSVAHRRNEIGIRLALGADPRDVLRLVLGEVGRLVGLGVGIGAVAALAAGRLVTAFLYGVSGNRPGHRRRHHVRGDPGRPRCRGDPGPACRPARSGGGVEGRMRTGDGRMWGCGEYGIGAR